MPRIRQLLGSFFEEPWKKRFYGGLLFTLGLLRFIFFFKPGAMEGDMGVKILLCPFRNLTGLPCPGCGLTRAVHLMAHGEFARAMSFHVFAPVFFLGVFLELVNSLVAILRRGRPLFYWGELLSRRILKVLVYSFVVLVVLYNFYRIYAIIHASSTFVDVVHDSIIYRLITAGSSIFRGS
jgi:hypothetical protein